ncbi:zinc finger, c2H2 type domain-containing protein [Purpureocillium lilacinum]|uniref:Zinc finger, c2H2 type domain-containing protein n=1 Tax=Purpureocillium lilacinum TaxID=33203 RepID=A0A179F1J5_PURLI|nr:zinc finger, c2H2 type domain-containing protein [Purpureocillium lilacinum]OAQ59281.1 zinc finger, c2H2 type domain-containing protein [Purpureocillium lilacinum]
MATKTASSQKVPANRTCPLCFKQFTRSYNLRSHLRTHKNERPYKCNVCSKAFARQHDRKRHERLHLGQMRFVCRGDLELGGQWGCGRAFSRDDGLARHLRSDIGSECIRPLLDQERKQHRRRSSPVTTGSTSPATTIAQQPIAGAESLAAIATPMDLDPNLTYPYVVTGMGWTSMVPVSAALPPQYPTLATERLVSPAYGAAMMPHPSRRMAHIKKNWPKQWHKRVLDGVKYWEDHYQGLPITTITPELRDDLQPPDEYDLLARELDVVSPAMRDLDEYKSFTAEPPVAIDLIAARDTSACLMSAAFFELARQPAVQAKIRAEVERQLDGRLVTVQGTSKVECDLDKVIVYKERKGEERAS